MSELMLNKELKTNLHLQSTIRARSLVALHRLDAEHQSIVLRFLYDNDLLKYVKSFLYSLDLNHTDLHGFWFAGADLSDTDGLTQQQLDQVFTCKGAILSRGLTCYRNQ